MGRQYIGQVGVFAGLSRGSSAGLVGGQLYLPRPGATPLNTPNPVLLKLAKVELTYFHCSPHGGGNIIRGQLLLFQPGIGNQQLLVEGLLFGSEVG